MPLLTTQFVGRKSLFRVLVRIEIAKSKINRAIQDEIDFIERLVVVGLRWENIQGNGYFHKIFSTNQDLVDFPHMGES